MGMTTQEAFDKSVTALLKQNKKSEDGRKCMYRGPEGRKCAIGHLIPDSIYDPSMERKGVNVLRYEFPEVADLLEDVNIELLNQLQLIHDTTPPKAWELGFNLLAYRYKLDTSVLPNPQAWKLRE